MRRLTLLFAVTVFVVATTASFAQQAAPKPPDPRLDKKITLKMEKTRLPDVLAEVMKQTGVDISVSKEKRFWAVRQRKVTMFLKDMPLKDFIAQLKLLLGYYITRTGKDGDYKYIIWQDMKGRMIEQELVDAQRRRKEEYKRRAVYDTLSDAQRALAMTPEEAKEAWKTNPWLAYLATDPQMKSYASLLCSIPSAHFDGLLRTDNMYLEVGQLSPDAKAAIEKIESIERPLMETNYKQYGEYTVTSISIRPNGRDSDASPDYSYSLSVQATPNDQSSPHNKYMRLGLGRFNITPSNSEGQLQAAAIAKRVSEGMERDTAVRKVLNAISKGEREGLSQEEALKQLLGIEQAKKQVQKKVDPDLEKPVDLIVKDGYEHPGYINKLLDVLSSESGYNVTYEYFNKQNSPSSGIRLKGKLGEILKSIADDYGLEWTKDGNTLRFRCKDWALRRTWEINDNLIKKMASVDREG